jgi:hypothetical protein
MLTALEQESRRGHPLLLWFASPAGRPLAATGSGQARFQVPGRP